MLRLDHIAVAGETLREATQACEDALGVPLEPGGQHPHFGTHNTLLGLANGLYLEAIAIDPDAPPLAHARWFGLDDFKGAARLSNWICATDDLAGALERLPKGAGTPVALARGDLRWQMAVPASGQLPFHNMFPALIQWQGNAHPSARLAPSGCGLQSLVVTHPEAEILGALLRPLLADDRIVFKAGPPGLRAEIETPGGLRWL